MRFGAALRHPCRRNDKQSTVSSLDYASECTQYCHLAVKQQQARSLPEADVVGAACLGAAFLGDSLLLANCEPTELSKKPPPEDPLVGEDCLGAGADFLGDSLLLANWAPTELSKNPLEEPAFGSQTLD